MTKRTLNKSLYNAKENTINWKVFVVFITSSNYVKDALFRVDLESTKASQKLSFAQESLIGISIDAVNENKTLDEIFEQFMQPTVVSYQLSLFVKEKRTHICIFACWYTCAFRSY